MKLTAKSFDFVVNGISPVKGQLVEPGAERPIGYRSPNEAEITAFREKFPEVDEKVKIAPLGATFKFDEGKPVLALAISMN